MEFLLTIMSPEAALIINAIGHLLGEAMQVQIVQNALLVVIVWKIVKRDAKKEMKTIVSEHLNSIQTSLRDLVGEVGGLRESLVRVESSHANRINGLENSVKEIRARIGLEQQQPSKGESNG